MDDLTKLTDEELIAKNEALMAERAAVETRVKADQMLVQAEMDRRAIEIRVTRTLESLTDQEKKILADRLKRPGPPMPLPNQTLAKLAEPPEPEEEGAAEPGVSNG